MTATTTPKTQPAKVRGNVRTAIAVFIEDSNGDLDPKIETKLQGRWKCARLLAEAEAEARDRLWEVHWFNDAEGCNGCDCGSDACPCASGNAHDVLCAVLRDEADHVLASLGSICEPSREYRRVIEAELALEAL